MLRMMEVGNYIFIHGRYLFIFTNGYYSFHDQDVAITWLIDSLHVKISLQMIAFDFKNETNIDLQRKSLVELKRKSIGVKINTFLTNECYIFYYSESV